ncbi:hypothetical protein BDN70DRAFT_879742 [Pholiota conissans]|uniref:Uncharacterized protein n=1 Tax=Pholiota conissans TaxID=109636 RepID=A0A9P5Z0L4_9AGAR|nr:hypothetical protein BDN70DRAFT_879742 [Pholiota conissans]
MFTMLESYSLSFTPVSSYVTLDFEKIGLQMREILIHPALMLRHLRLEGIRNFPFYTLLSCYPNLQHLKLIHMHFDKSPTPKGMLPLKTIKLCSFTCGSADLTEAVTSQQLLSLQQYDGEPVFDVSRVKHLDITSNTRPELATGRAILLHLETIILRANVAAYSAIDLTGLGKLLLSSSRHLKEIMIFTDIGLAEGHDPLCGLCEELEVLGSHENILGALSFTLTTYFSNECSTGDEWGKLDQVIDKFEWPMLKDVSIEISVGQCLSPDSDSTSDEGNEVNFRRRLKTLPQRQLPRLFSKSRKGLKFRYSISDEYDF